MVILHVLVNQTKIIGYAIETGVKKWGQGSAHIILPGDLIYREFQVVIDNDMHMRTSKRFGTGCHITLPMKNVYDGVVVLDDNGEAEIELSN